MKLPNSYTTEHTYLNEVTALAVAIVIITRPIKLMCFPKGQDFTQLTHYGLNPQPWLQMAICTSLTAKYQALVSQKGELKSWNSLSRATALNKLEDRRSPSYFKGK